MNPTTLLSAINHLECGYGYVRKIVWSTISAAGLLHRVTFIFPLWAGYAKQLPFAGPVGSHWLVEAMKTAFALRTHLGDPGPCTSQETCFLDLEAVLNDTLSEDFAESLR